MHWFDRLSKDAAGDGVSRRTALWGFGLITGALAVPWNGSELLADAQTLPATGLRRAPKLTGVPPRVLFTPPPSAGPCRVENGGISLTTTSSSLQLSMRQTPTVERASNKSPVLVGLTSVVEITRSGEPLLRIEAKFNPVEARGPADGTVELRYGAAVKGLRKVSFAIRENTISGAVDDRAIVPFGVREPVTAQSPRFADGRPAATLDIDPALREEIAALIERAKSDAGSCSAPHHMQHASARRTHLDLATPTSRRSALRAVMVADYGAPNAGATQQNNLTSNIVASPDCLQCWNDAGKDFTACYLGAIASAFFCGGCAVPAMAACYTGYASGVGACYVPGAGCNQVTCPSFLSSCDTGYTCCSDICCPAGDTCFVVQGSGGGNGGICCPASSPVGCDGGCFAPGSVCCGSYACGAGYACGDNFACIACAAPNVVIGGQCCPAAAVCGSTCCESPGICSPNKVCVVPSFGSAAPATPIPTACTRSVVVRHNGLSMTRTVPGVTCFSPVDKTGRFTARPPAVCCGAGETCCGGTCCGPNPVGGTYYCVGNVCTVSEQPR